MSETRLLAIDDDEGFRRLLAEIADDAGHRSAITGDAALFRTAYAEIDPTVIVLNMVMPEIDGFELMQWLMEQGYSSRVVLVTGFSARSAEMARTLAAEHGLTDVITLSKPMRSADLRAALDLS